MTNPDGSHFVRTLLESARQATSIAHHPGATMRWKARSAIPKVSIKQLMWLVFLICLALSCATTIHRKSVLRERGLMMHDRIDAFLHVARHEVPYDEEAIDRQVEMMYQERDRLLDLAAYPWEESVADKALRTAKAELDQPREGLGEMVRERRCFEMLLVLQAALGPDIEAPLLIEDLGPCSSQPPFAEQAESGIDDLGPHSSHAPFSGRTDSLPVSLNDILKHVKAYHDIRLYIKNGRLIIEG